VSRLKWVVLHPEQVFTERVAEIAQIRQRALQRAYEAHPERLTRPSLQVGVNFDDYVPRLNGHNGGIGLAWLPNFFTTAELKIEPYVKCSVAKMHLFLLRVRSYYVIPTR
jgi:hypothetical protein